MKLCFSFYRKQMIRDAYNANEDEMEWIFIERYTKLNIDSVYFMNVKNWHAGFYSSNMVCIRSNWQ